MDYYKLHVTGKAVLPESFDHRFEPCRPRAIPPRPGQELVVQRIVALVLPTDVAYGRMVLRGVARYTRGHERWSLELVPDWQGHPERIIRWGGDGIIAMGDSPPMAEGLRASRRPFVNVGDAQPAGLRPSIFSDNQAIGRMGAEHFLDRGFSSLAFYGIAGKFYAQKRGEGFLARAGEAGKTAAYVERHPEDTEDPGWGRRAVHWLAKLPKPLGLMACNDDLGRLLSRHFLAGGVRIPEEVALLGVDNDETLCELGEVAMSSVAVDAERIGYLAAHELDRQFSGNPPSSKALVVPPQAVVVRSSSDVFAIHDPVVSTAMQYIRQHVTERPSVSEVADKMPIGRRTLEKRFRMVMGRSVLHEIQRARVEVAKELLLKSELQMDLVAKRAGFLDPRQMWLIFRKHVGRSPSQFRSEKKMQ